MEAHGFTPMGRVTSPLTIVFPEVKGNWEPEPGNSAVTQMQD